MKNNYLKLISLIFFSFCATTLTYAQNDAEDYYVKGEVFAETGKYEQAIMAYEVAIAKDAQNPKYLYKLGVTYQKSGKPGKAEEIYKKTVKVDENFVDAHLKLALIYKEKKDFDKCIKHLDAAFRGTTEVDKQLAYKTRIINILDMRKRFDEAGPHIEDAKSIAPNNNYILFMDAKYHNYITKNYELAKNSLQLAIAQMEAEKGKAHEHYYYELGVAHHSLEDYQNANIAFKEVRDDKLRSKLSSMTPEYLYQVASAYYQVYNLEEASSILHSIIKMNNTFEPAYDLLIELEENKLDRSEVIKLLEHKVSIQKDNTEKVKILADLIDFELKFGDYDNAFRHLEEFNQNGIPLPDVKFMQAVAYHSNNENEKAIILLEDLINYNGPKVKYRSSFLLGTILVKEKKYKEAKLAFSQPFPAEFSIAAKEQMKLIKQKEKDEIVQNK
ncbi:lipopolysaccharide assembly protein LapB [Flammeovirga sp. OC4]|uniref:tetratricopeptide repeat protein n=1 Tax=Flammeovirga sp. OC4 TaxID=1382345 RepID=UPI0005C7A329|nr:tetratricopeptide repeat protein [Flammeovirga sp. OC4]